MSLHAKVDRDDENSGGKLQDASQIEEIRGAGTGTRLRGKSVFRISTST